uniref:CSON009773 protein n=1 Tax=Culicoides sonorensis TaxID=179676 RepID=A0A336M0X4_CULSO
MLLDPVNRSSRWRYDQRAPINYDDNGINCGGFSMQHDTNGGKCGICGDNYLDQRPRPNELGGVYGQGTVVKTYKSGSKITATVKITANHKGYFVFDLCNMDPLKSIGKSMEEENCFEKVITYNGSEQFILPSTDPGQYYVELKLPSMKCKHCVLRWTYTAGNSWGWCEDGTGRIGCGAQETFRGCSDIELI